VAGVAHAARNARGDSRKAADMYSKAISLQADCTVAHYNLAIHLKKEGKLLEALQSLERVVKLTPEDPVVRCQLGSLLLDVQSLKPKALLGKLEAFVKGDSEEARAMLEQQALAQKKDEAQRALRLEEAWDHFHQAVVHASDMVEAKVGKGLVLMERKDYAEAVMHFEEALRPCPSLLSLAQQYCPHYCTPGCDPAIHTHTIHTGSTLSNPAWKWRRRIHTRVKTQNHSMYPS